MCADLYALNAERAVGPVSQTHIPLGELSSDLLANISAMPATGPRCVR